ncbi:MAG TPA: hypothetical protein VLB76_25455 [Thermoanaerobaculia bacterium]|nr:hypothetical protein [Thermoanaerobaculia bacterium]
MRWRYAYGLVLATLCCIGCLSGIALAGASAAEQEEIKFLVGTSGSSKPLPGVEVILLSAVEHSLGRTDKLGTLSVKASVIRKSKAQAVLFCAEYFFCGAIQVNPDLFEYSEKYIELAPLAVR